jgi:hypothetical protein
MLPVVWFTARANDKHGAHLDLSEVGGVPDRHNHHVASVPLHLLTGQHSHQATALRIKQFFFKNRHGKVDLYLNKDSSSPERDGDTVDFHRHGLTKDHPILFVDRNHDRVESKEEKDEKDVESIDNRFGEYANFTKKLKNITSGDWNIYPEAIKNTYEGEILWTDGKSNHSFRTAPTIQAYRVVRRKPNRPDGRVIAHGLASASPYYFKLV